MGQHFPIRPLGLSPLLVEGVWRLILVLCTAAGVGVGLAIMAVEEGVQEIVQISVGEVGVAAT